jgi:hypothetical protein
MPQNSLTGQPQVGIPNTSDKCIPGGAIILSLTGMVFDGTGTITYNFNQAGVAFRSPFSIRTMYFDARGLSADATVSFNGGPTLRIPAGKQGYINVFMPSPVNCAITSAAGNGALNIYLYNFKIYPQQW